MDAEKISLKEAFHSDPSGTRFLVVKNVPPGAEAELFELYFEAMCRGHVVEGVKSVENEPDTVVVEFTDSITDIDSVQQKVEGRPLNGAVLSVSHLGIPKGLFIAGLKKHVSHEILQLKFENKRFGGVSECVKEVEFIQDGPLKHAYLHIKNVKALKSILSIDNHVHENAELNVQPYYPAIHDDIVKKLKTTHYYHYRTGTDDNGASPTQNQKKKLPGGANKGPKPFANPGDDKRPVPRQRPPRSPANPVPHSAEATGDIGQTSNLRVFYDKPSEQFMNRQQNDAVHVNLDNEDDDDDDDNLFNNQRPAHSRGEPRQRPSRGRGRGHRGRARSFDGRRNNQNSLTLPVDEPGLNVEEEMQLSSSKITLLIIYRFQTKNANQSFKVILQERNGKAIIKGSNEDDIREAKLKIHECLDRAEYISEPLSEPRHAFLSRTESMNCMRQRTKLEKIPACFEVLDSPTELRCYAFSRDHCENAMKFIKDEIKRKWIDLRPGQEKLFVEDSWKSLARELDIGLTTVYVETDGTKVVIESFLEHKTGDAIRRILAFLKNNKPQEKDEITLIGARARCFDVKLNVHLTQTVRNQHGKLWVNTVNREPFTISVSVQGDQRVVDALKHVSEQICTEPVDIHMISKDLMPEEIWLFYKGLNSQVGKDFLKQFETLHNCFFDIEEDGLFVSPKRQKKTVKVRKSPPLEAKKVVEVDHRPRVMPKSRTVQEYGDMMVADRQAQRPLPVPRRAEVRPMQVGRLQTAHPMASGTQTLKISGVTVVLKQGQIVDEMANALVNIVSPNHDMGESVLSKELMKKCGQGLVQTHQMEVQRMRLTDEKCYVTATDSFNLRNCSTILHVALKKGAEYCNQMIPVAMKEIFRHCKKRSCFSISIPPLGVGRMYKYPPDQVIQLMLSTINTYYSKPRSHKLENITIVVFDNETRRAFENVFQSFDTSPSQLTSPVRPAARFGQLSKPNVYGQPASSYGVRASGVSGADDMSSDERRLRDRLSFGRVDPSRRTAHASNDVESELDSEFEILSIRDRIEEDVGYARQGISLSYTKEVKMTKPVSRPRTSVRDSRFPEDQPVPRVKLSVTAVSRIHCKDVRTQLGAKIKEELLFTESLAKKDNVSIVSKQKIIKILVANDVKSFKAGDKYNLKGQKDKVNKVFKEILQILLEDPGKQPKKIEKPNLANVRQGTAQFVSIMIDLEPGLPEYWRMFKPDASLKDLLKEGKNQNASKVTLSSASSEYQAIDQMFQANIDLQKVGQGQDAIGITYSNLNVIKIQRIENLSLYEPFARKRIELYQKLHRAGLVGFTKINQLHGCTGPVATERYMNASSKLKQDVHSSLNEFLLFHGTKPEFVEVICNGGFDERRCSGRAMFGQGIYGAEKSMKADQYTDSKHGRLSGPGQHKYMFLMRMVLGNSYLCRDNNPPKYCRPPCTSCNDDKCNNHDHVGPLGHIFDSVTGDNGKLFREFVVYDRSLCYPEYLITYERI